MATVGTRRSTIQLTPGPSTNSVKIQVTAYYFGFDGAATPGTSNSLAQRTHTYNWNVTAGTAESHILRVTDGTTQTDPTGYLYWDADATVATVVVTPYDGANGTGNAGDPETLYLSLPSETSSVRFELSAGGTSSADYAVPGTGITIDEDGNARPRINNSVTSLTNLSDVTLVSAANLDVLAHNGSNWADVALTASHIQSGSFADARIAQSNVTQHEAALSIASTQITGLTAADVAAGTFPSGGHSFAGDVTLDAGASIFFDDTATASGVTGGSALFFDLDGGRYRSRITWNDGGGNFQWRFNHYYDGANEVFAYEDAGASEIGVPTYDTGEVQIKAAADPGGVSVDTAITWDNLFSVNPTYTRTTQPLQLPFGTVGAPGLTFTSETTLGLFRHSAATLGVAATRLRMPNNSPLVWEDSGGSGRDVLYINSSDDLIVRNAAGDILFQPSGTVTYLAVQGATNVWYNNSDTANNNQSFYIDDADTLFWHISHRATSYPSTPSEQKSRILFYYNGSTYRKWQFWHVGDSEHQLWVDNTEVLTLKDAAPFAEILGADDELLRLQQTSATGNPYISFYQSTNRRAYIQLQDSTTALRIVAEEASSEVRIESANTLMAEFAYGSYVRFRNSVDEHLQLRHASATGNPKITFYQTSTLGGSVEYRNATPGMVYEAEPASNYHQFFINNDLVFQLKQHAAPLVFIQGNFDEMLRMDHDSATGNPEITFYRSGTVGARITMDNTVGGLKFNSAISTGSDMAFQTGGTNRLQINGIDADEARVYVSNGQFHTQSVSAEATITALDWDTGNVQWVEMDSGNSGSTPNVGVASMVEGGTYVLIVRSGTGGASQWSSWTGVTAWVNGNVPQFVTSVGELCVVQFVCATVNAAKVVLGSWYQVT